MGATKKNVHFFLGLENFSKSIFWKDPNYSQRKQTETLKRTTLSRWTAKIVFEFFLWVVRIFSRITFRKIFQSNKGAHFFRSTYSGCEKTKITLALSKINQRVTLNCIELFISYDYPQQYLSESKWYLI